MIIGICGYIGSGKTTACWYLTEKYNFFYINADRIARELMKEKFVIDFISENFANVVKDGVIDRKALREIIFYNKKENMKLVNFLWPLVDDKIKKLVEENKNRDIVVEAIGMNYLTIDFDHIIYLKTKKKYIIKRVTQRDNQSVSQTLAVMKIQKKYFKTKKRKTILKTGDNNHNLMYVGLDNLITLWRKEMHS